MPDFQPNPSYKQPPINRTHIDLDANGLGILLRTPGQYTAMIGGIVLLRGYPWKMGVFSIVGIGDTSLGPARPYRRDLPPINGSLSLLHVDQVPCNLTIAAKYSTSYLDYSFTVNVSSATERVWLYIEPDLDGGVNNLTILATKTRYINPKPLTINSTFYWNSFGNKTNLLEANLTVGTFDPSSIPEFPSFPVLPLLFFATSATAVVLKVAQKRPRSKTHGNL